MCPPSTRSRSDGGFSGDHKSAEMNERDAPMPQPIDDAGSSPAHSPEGAKIPGPHPRQEHSERLGRAIRERTARVGVIGLGYVGLPLVELFAAKGFPVLGL